MAVSLKPIGEQVIVITGASSGIGLATAEAAARAGAKLVLTARNETVIAEAAKRISEAGGEAAYVAADVANRAELQRARRGAGQYRQRCVGHRSAEPGHV